MAERERERAGWKNWSEVHIAAPDRAGWWESVKALCATWHEADRRGEGESEHLPFLNLRTFHVINIINL